MSNTLHVARNYEVKYSSTSAFNYKPNELYELLTELDCSVYLNNESVEDFEITRDDFNDAIAKLKNYYNLDEDLKEDIANRIRNLVCWDDDEKKSFDLNKGLEEVINMFVCFEKESDQNTDILHFMYF